MSGRQNYTEEAQRQQLNEANPPPTYSEAVNAVTPLPQVGGPTAPSSSSPPTGPSIQTPVPSTAESEGPVSLEMEIFALRRELERQREERMCLGCGKTLARLGIQAGSTAHSAHALGQSEGTESLERKIIEIQVKTIMTGWKTERCLERIIQRRWEVIKDKNNIIERKGDRVKSIATHLVAVEAELGRMKRREETELAIKKQPWEVEEVTYLGNIQSVVGDLVERVFEVIQGLLGL